MSITSVMTPQSRQFIGIARGDITPPVGIYHRMWGAALHDQSTGVHRSLLATVLYIQPIDGADGIVIIGLDHCLLDPSVFLHIRRNVAFAVNVDVSHVHVAMSHTHGSAWMSVTRADLPGGQLIAPYLAEMRQHCVQLAGEAKGNAVDATILYGQAACSLARHRNYQDPLTKQIVCGYNPEGTADQTVMLGKIIASTGEVLGSIVNYACHPTTLAWENTLISPDYIGAMRETIEQHVPGPCLFLQGASAELGPKHGYVGDVSIADRNGRQLGFAALSGLEELSNPGEIFVYQGPVISGATLGTWKYEPVSEEQRAAMALFDTHEFRVPLLYRIELPTLKQTVADRERWEQEELAAKAANDDGRIRDCRAQIERMTRQIARLEVLPEGRVYEFPIRIMRLGMAIWVFAPGEFSESFQIRLRAAFPNYRVIVSTITNDWQPGYIPPTDWYGQEIYQEIIAATAPGSMEFLIHRTQQEIERILQATTV